jgi:hypothetical protein
MDVPVDLTPTGLTNIVVTLTNRPSRLSGVARNDGKPLGGAVVGVFPVDRSLWRRPGMASRRVQTAAPNRDGQYLLIGLPPGDYYMAAVSGASVDFSDPSALVALIPSATRFSLAEGESRTQDLRVVVVR